ncbi:MAG TPA: hypothetical protein VJ024_06550 [Thermodesulfovibrionales bacterium]|nr:hypothetical protein [Thermodesulfovibrionales bacterium]
MRRGRKYVFGCLLLLTGLVVACGPVHQTLRPDHNNLDNVKKLAIVVPAEGEFTVFYERAKATATPAIMFGLIGVAVASAHNKSQDEALAKTIGSHLDGFSCRSAFKESLLESLMNSGRFSDIQIFDKKLESGEISKYDAVITFHIPNWGIRIVERGKTELMSSFVEFETEMIEVRSSNIVWKEHDTVIGQSKRTLSSYQNEKESCRKDVQETAEDAGQRIANILIYQ